MRRLLLVGALCVLSSAALAIYPYPTILPASEDSYSTWNPGDSGSAWTFSLSNTKASLTNYFGTTQVTRGTRSRNSGKWYFEVVTTLFYSYGSVGIATSAHSLNASYLGQYSTGYGWMLNDGKVYYNASSSAYGTAGASGNTLGVAVDLDNNKLYIAKNGTWQNSANPAAGTGGYSITNATYFPAADFRGLFQYTSTTTHTINTGASSFSYTPPSGFSAWH